MDLPTLTCLTAIPNDPWVWHRKLGYASMHAIKKLSRLDLVIGLPKPKFERNIRVMLVGFRNKLGNPSKLQTLSGHQSLSSCCTWTCSGQLKWQVLVVDIIPTLLLMITLISLVLSFCLKSIKLSQILKFSIKRFKRKQFTLSPAFTVTTKENLKINSFKNFATTMEYLKTSPHLDLHNKMKLQNGKIDLQDTTQTMLLDQGLLDHFWAEAVSTTFHMLNRCMMRPILRKTPYELQKGKKPNISYFHSFGCKYYVDNNVKTNLGKFGLRSDEGMFLGYSPSS